MTLVIPEKAEPSTGTTTLRIMLTGRTIGSERDRYATALPR